MSENRQPDFYVLRSVIESYQKKKEALEKREVEVREKLAQLRKKSPREDESFEINIETRESFVRSTSEVITPTGSYLPQADSQNATCDEGSEELLFHSKYSSYKDLDCQSMNYLSSNELIGLENYVSSPKEKNTRKSKFSYKNYDKRHDLELDSDSQENRVTSSSKRKRAKRRASQKETPELVRKYGRNPVHTREPLESVSDRSSSQIDSDRELVVSKQRPSDGRKHKGKGSRKAECVPERLERIGLEQSEDRSMAKYSGNQEYANSKCFYSRYEDEETRDCPEFVKREKSVRPTSKRKTDQLSGYPVLKDFLGVCPDAMTNAPDRKSKKSKQSNKKALSRKDSIHNYEIKHDHRRNRHHPIHKPSITSDSGSLSQYDFHNETYHVLETDSSQSVVEEQSRLRSLHRPSERRVRSHSPTERLEQRPINAYSSAMSRRANERGSSKGESIRPYSRESHVERTHSPSYTRDQLLAYRDSTKGESIRPYSHESHVERSHSPSYSRDQLLAYRDSTKGESVRPYSRESHVERSHSPSYSRDQLASRLSTGNGRESRSQDVDEVYSTNFLTFLIRKCLPRALSSNLLNADEWTDKSSKEVLNLVSEVSNIKKLICDELDRREIIGKPFKIRRREKELLMNNLRYVKMINDRLEKGHSVYEALSNSPSGSTIRLQERTIHAIKVANKILGGDQPDPEEAEDLEAAAAECLQKLCRLNIETVSNTAFQDSAPRGPASIHHQPSVEYTNQLLDEDTCENCRETNWFSDEFSKLKGAIMNIEQHMNTQADRRATKAKLTSDVNQFFSTLKYETPRDFPAPRGSFQQKFVHTPEDTIQVGTFHMPKASSTNLIKNYYSPSCKVGKAPNNYVYASPVYKNRQVHRQR